MMKFRNVLLGFLLPLVAMADQPRPNVVVIVSDDHRYDLMGHKGCDYMKTPHLDRLAAEGCSFENAFVGNGICSPSRAAIMTGKYSQRASCFSILLNNDSFLENQTMFPAYLQQAGYRTGYIGKFHLGRETEPKEGFDLWASFPFVGGFFDEPLWINGEKVEKKGFTDYNIADFSADTIRQWAGEQEPFFLMVGLKAPHIPYEYPPELEEAVKGPIKPPVSYGQMPEGIQGTLIDCRTFPYAEEKYGGFSPWVEAYAKSATSIDFSVGRILEALETAGVADDTLVIYTSDHGYSLGEFSLVEKHYAYEHVMRIPMIVKYPGHVASGAEKEDMVLGVDIAPTVLDWCGAKVPSAMDGKSWDKLFKNEDRLTDGFRDEFFYDFYHYMGEQRLPAMQAVRTASHKLIEYERKAASRELYDLVADPHELDNRIDDPAFADVLADLEKRMKRLKKEHDWAPRVIEPLKDYYLLGTFTTKEDAQVFPALRDGAFSLEPLTLSGKRYNWTEVHQADNWISIPQSADGPLVAYIALPVKRVAREDPCFQIWSYLPGMELEENRPAPAIAGFFAGKQYFETVEYAEAEGREGFPYRFFNRFNPPLRKGDNLVWLRILVPPGEGIHRFRLDQIYPSATLDFELTH